MQIAGVNRLFPLSETKKSGGKTNTWQRHFGGTLISAYADKGWHSRRACSHCNACGFRRRSESTYKVDLISVHFVVTLLAITDDLCRSNLHHLPGCRSTPEIRKIKWHSALHAVHDVTQSVKGYDITVNILWLIIDSIQISRSTSALIIKLDTMSLG